MKKKVKEPALKLNTEGPGLKVGQEVLYMTPYVLDRTSVEEVDKKENTAKLSNGVKVSRYYTSNGYLSSLNTASSVIIRLWSEETSQIFEYQLAIRNIKSLSDKLVSLALDSPKDVTINIYNKLNKILKRYE